MGYFHFQMGQNSGNHNGVYNWILRAITYLAKLTKPEGYLFLDSVQEWGNFTL